MRINILLFAHLRERIGKSMVAIDVPAGAIVADTLHYIGADPTNLLFAVNCEYAARDTVLHDGDEVALIPPVAGG